VTAQSPGHHQIGGYVVDRVKDGETVTWEVIHPDQGLTTTVDTLPDAREWIRQHPIPREPKKPVPYRAQRKAGLICRGKKRNGALCTSTTVQGSLYCGRHARTQTQKMRARQT